MDRPEKLFDQPVDRTPYGACAWVAVLVAAIFFVVAGALWNAGSWIKQKHWSLPGFSLPSANLNTKDIGGQVQDTLNNAASSAAQSAADAATQAAKDAVQKQAEATQQGIQGSLQNSLK